MQAQQIAPNGELPYDTAPDIAEFYKYWMSLPRAGLVPRLSDYIDHAPAHLQPFVGIVEVFSPTEACVRLYGTGLSNITGVDLTGKGISEFYPEHLRAIVTSILWDAASRPAGYLCVRDTRTQAGLTVHSPSICLPLVSRTSGSRLIINYSNMPRSDIHHEAKDTCLVTAVRVTHWIDVGAGTPAQQDT